MRRPVYCTVQNLTFTSPVTFFYGFVPREAGDGGPLSLGQTRPWGGEGVGRYPLLWVFSGTRPDLSQGVLRRSAVSYDA